MSQDINDSMTSELSHYTVGSPHKGGIGPCNGVHLGHCFTRKTWTQEALCYNADRIDPSYPPATLLQVIHPRPWFLQESTLLFPFARASAVYWATPRTYLTPTFPENCI